MQMLPDTSSTDAYFSQSASVDLEHRSIQRLLAWPFFNFDERRLRTFWRLLIHLILAVIFILFPYLSLGALASAFELSELLESQALAGFVQSCAFVAATVICFLLVDRRPLCGRLGREWSKNFLFGLALGSAAMMTILSVEYLLGWVEIVQFFGSEETPVATLLGKLIVYLILFTAVAFGEESLSRAYQLKNISEGLSFLGPVIASCSAIMITSTIFALLHWFNPNANLISTLGILAAGLLLAAARVFTGSLAAPIGIHLTWNFFQGPVFGFPVSGNTFFDSLIVINQGGPELWTGGAFGPEAGLIGIVVLVLMLGALWFWSELNHRHIPLEIIKLAHYKARFRPSTKQLSDEPITASVLSLSPQTAIEENDDNFDEDSKS